MTTKEEVKALWKRCFDDTQEFVDLYFAQRYKDDINHVVRRDGQVVAALQAIPYPMTFCGEMISASYISGACTHPDYRSQGLMSGLLADTHRQMYEQGISLAMLIPAESSLFDYYARSGYASVFGYVRHTVKALSLRPSTFYTITDETYWKEYRFDHYHYLTTTLQKRPCCVQHCRNDFWVIMEDLRLSDGKLLAARHAGRMVGMAFCVQEGNRTVIKELLADNALIQDSLLDKAAQLYQTEELDCLTPGCSDSHYLGMARLIHPEKMLAMFATRYPKLELHIELTGDETIPANNGYYNICQGRCTCDELPDSSYSRCNLQEFTRLLLKAEHPYMSLMLN